MDKNTIFKQAFRFIDKQQFITVGTVTKNNKPHVSPKILVSGKETSFIVADYILGKTAKNLKNNKYISISAFDIEKMVGYHIQGTVSCIQWGPEYEKLVKQWDKRQTTSMRDRVIERVQGKRSIKSIELTILKPKIFYKIKPLQIEKIDRGKVFESL